MTFMVHFSSSVLIVIRLVFFSWCWDLLSLGRSRMMIISDLIKPNGKGLRYLSTAVLLKFTVTLYCREDWLTATDVLVFSTAVCAAGEDEKVSCCFKAAHANLRGILSSLFKERKIVKSRSTHWRKTLLSHFSPISHHWIRYGLLLWMIHAVKLLKNKAAKCIKRLKEEISNRDHSAKCLLQLRASHKPSGNCDFLQILGHEE